MVSLFKINSNLPQFKSTLSLKFTAAASQTYAYGVTKTIVSKATHMKTNSNNNKNESEKTRHYIFLCFNDKKGQWFLIW